MGTTLVSREELLSRREVAALLGVSGETLKGWARRGVGPAFSRSGPVRGRVWYQAADVLMWLEQRKQVLGPSPDRERMHPVGGVCLGVASEKNRDVPIQGGGRGGHDEKRPGVFHAEKGTAS